MAPSKTGEVYQGASVEILGDTDIVVQADDAWTCHHCVTPRRVKFSSVQSLSRVRLFATP